MTEYCLENKDNEYWQNTLLVENALVTVTHTRRWKGVTVSRGVSALSCVAVSVVSWVW